MIEEIFTPCVQTCLNHVEDMFTLRLHHIYRHVYIMLEDMFTWYLRTCLNNIRRHIYSMLEDMFTPSLNICLHHVGKPVFTLYEICLPNILRHICTVLKEILTQCWKTWFYHVWRWMFEDNFQSYLKTCLHNIWRLFFASCSNVCYVMYEDLLTQHFKHVWRRIHTMLADMLTQNWWHLLQICEVIFITICSKWCQLLKARQTNILKMFG